MQGSGWLPCPECRAANCAAVWRRPGAAAGGEVEVVLNCVLWRQAYRSSASEILWQDHATAKLFAGADGAQATVEFEIPFDVRATGDYGRGNLEHVFWRLTARSTDGAFQASFTVPVFPTAESDPSRTREHLETEAGSQLGGYSPAPGRIGKAVTPEGIRYYFPRGRNRSAAAMASVFGVISLGTAVAVGIQINGWLSLGALAGTLLPAAIGSLMLVMGVWLWFADTTVMATTGELRICSSCLGISHTRVVHAGEMRGFDIRPGLQKGAEVWYDLWLQTAGGKDANAGTGMDKTEAEWFAAELRKDLGVGR